MASGSSSLRRATEERSLAHVARRATAEAAHQFGFVHLEEQHGIERSPESGQRCGKTLGLRGGTHHPVEDGPPGRHRRRERFLHDAHDDGIGYEIAAIHGRLGFEPQGCAFTDRGAEDITRRDLGNVKASG